MSVNPSQILLDGGRLLSIRTYFQLCTYTTKEWFLFYRLALSFGHDHIGDGLRPSLPNYVHIGMLNCQCQPKTAVPDSMVQFMESDEAKKFGVIIVAFGTLIGPPQVSCCNQSNDFS